MEFSWLTLMVVTSGCGYRKVTSPGDRPQLALLARSPQLAFVLRLSPRVDIIELSSAGEAIARILGLAHGNTEPAGLIGSEPIVARSAAEPLQISRGLRNGLATSGLFYESHVAEWVGGARVPAPVDWTRFNSSGCLSDGMSLTGFAG